MIRPFRPVERTFVALGGEAQERLHDDVTLDRVICCYPGMPALIGQSAAKAHSIYGLVYPRDTWWVRVGVGMFNRWSWIRRRRFRAFVHRQADVDALVRRGGFVPRVVRITLLWHVTVYGRA